MNLHDLNQKIFDKSFLVDSIENLEHVKSLKSFLDLCEWSTPNEEEINKARSDMANILFYINHLERKQFNNWLMIRNESKGILESIKNNIGKLIS